jgi:hypothetical protein
VEVHVAVVLSFVVDTFAAVARAVVYSCACEYTDNLFHTGNTPDVNVQVGVVAVISAVYANLPV